MTRKRKVGSVSNMKGGWCGVTRKEKEGGECE